MTPPKPPRQDDDATPVDSPRLRTPATPVRGTPLVRPATERGGGPAAHQVYGPQRRKEESWDDKTPTTDPEMYRAVKELKTQTAAQNVEIAVIKSEVSGIKDAVGDMRHDIKTMSGSLVRVATLVENDRSKVTLTDTTRTASATVEGELAKRLLDQDERKAKFREKIWVKIVGGIFGGTVLTAVVAGLVAIVQGKC